MIPQGTGWQQLRSLALNAIPIGTKVYHRSAVPLHLWRDKGTFIVTACTKNHIVIEAAGAEIGAVLLADTEHLLDQAAEHQASLREVLTTTKWHSPAWTLVTTYYWAFFLELALSRLTGRSVWFLDRVALSQMRILAGSPVQPSAGPMYLTVDDYVSATNREISLKPSRSQYHDACWSLGQALIHKVFQDSDQNSNSMEYRLWWSLKRTADLWGPNWPSKIRNAVNYRPGYCYREVIGRDRIDTMKLLRQRMPVKFQDLIGQIEDAVMSIPRGANPEACLGLSSSLLGLYAIALSAIAKTLHLEVITRQLGDSRWRNLRATFFSARCATSIRSVWPFSESIDT